MQPRRPASAGCLPHWISASTPPSQHQASQQPQLPTTARRRPDSAKISKKSQLANHNLSLPFTPRSHFDSASASSANTSLGGGSAKSATRTRSLQNSHSNSNSSSRIHSNSPSVTSSSTKRFPCTLR
eukprot:gnl/Hemi2/2428_TR857_c0_g1_i1.p1 gnl/Hemi2/2428_TR857_c0_g1~~gnl/Hemi2/2428_TR857_c0_g1_i1.p1  ORF type:complete len:127 (+),score=43.44 gnl/Hemi2/2428_TR857_c0_g1_i1:165-545(+)